MLLGQRKALRARHSMLHAPAPDAATISIARNHEDVPHDPKPREI